MAKYAKAIAAFLTQGVFWVDAIVKSKPAHVTSTEWSALAAIAVATIAVFLVPNADNQKPTPPLEGV